MMKILLYCLMLCSLSLFAQDKLHITGKLTGIDDKVRIVIKSGEDEKETYLKDGLIDVSMYLKESPAVVRVIAYVKKNNPEYAFLFLGNESVVFSGDIKDFPRGLKVSNSVHDTLRYENDLLKNSLYNERSVIIDKYYTLVNQKQTTDSVNKALKEDELLESITQMTKEMQKIDYEFTKNHINTAYGRFMVMGGLNDYTDVQVSELFNLVEPQYYDTKEIKLLKMMLDHKELKIGDLYYDFTAVDINNKKVKFSNYFTGKYVLLDFSTYNCGYCQEAGPKTVKIAESLKQRLIYVTYYVGNDFKDIEKYYTTLKGSKGTLLWNIDGYNNSVLFKYRHQGTPDYLLFSTEGKLIQKFYGMQKDDFEVRLKELMK
ncbi:redoxin domain-containing protein [Myroides marinus]|uniref:TlpA family protein disulfide reductase n=1 Tax=Myroides marinus TaxID=703342 RepID=UPI0025776A1F|nr:hypothetical protein [Myroides marinus]MDM1362470.1 redoxin domain-containing protein [Myroides marinus]MDM1500856.1 redoxin domain-containing protein [Myroides marinus]